MRNLGKRVLSIAMSIALVIGLCPGLAYGGEASDTSLIAAQGSWHHNPEGFLDLATGGEGTVTVQGWAIDRDNTNASLEIHAYVGGPTGSSSAVGQPGIMANLARPDVNSTVGVPGNHGFHATFRTTKRGTVNVYTYAINIGGGTENSQLTNVKTVTITDPPGNAASITAGRYVLRSKLNVRTALDIAGLRTDNKAGLYLWEQTRGENQRFDISSAGNSSYFMVAKHSNKAIEIYGGSTDTGAALSQYDLNKSECQKWYFDKNSDGTYSLRNRLSGKVAEVKGAGTSNGTPIAQSPKNGSDAQKFYLVPNDVSRWSIGSIGARIYSGKAITPALTVKAGGITMLKGTDYSVSYKNNVKAGTATVTVTGMNGFTGSKSATFKIFGKPSYKGATSMPVSSKAHWTLKNCTIKVISGKDVVSVKGNVVTAKKTGVAKVGVYNKLGTRVATRSVTVYKLSGKYLMQSCMKGKSNMCLDMEGEGKGNGVQMIVWGKHGRANQQFTFERQSDGSYMVKSVNSKKYLDVNGASKAWGRNVIQWQRNGGKNQRWRITVDASNRLTFVNVNSGLVFDVEGGQADWGARMIQWGSNGGLNQKWKLVKVPARSYSEMNVLLTPKSADELRTVKKYDITGDDKADRVDFVWDKGRLQAINVNGRRAITFSPKVHLNEVRYLRLKNGASFLFVGDSWDSGLHRFNNGPDRVLQYKKGKLVTVASSNDVCAPTMVGVGIKRLVPSGNQLNVTFFCRDGSVGKIFATYTYACKNGTLKRTSTETTQIASINRASVTGITDTTVVSFAIYSDPQLTSKKAIIPKGQRVTIIGMYGTKGKVSYLLKTPSGMKGWFPSVRDDYLLDSENGTMFSNLVFPMGDGG